MYTITRDGVDKVSSRYRSHFLSLLLLFGKEEKEDGGIIVYRFSSTQTPILKPDPSLPTDAFIGREQETKRKKETMLKEKRVDNDSLAFTNFFNIKREMRRFHCFSRDNRSYM